MLFVFLENASLRLPERPERTWHRSLLPIGLLTYSQALSGFDRDSRISH